MENKEAKAYLRYVRIAPRKVQIVCDLIRGKNVGTAMAILMQTPKSASEPLMKLLKSAAANAENNFGMIPRRRNGFVKNRNSKIGGFIYAYHRSGCGYADPHPQRQQCQARNG